MSNNICNQITLCDGRRIGFSEFGDRQGRPVFYSHGFPGSRLQVRLADRISRDSQVRFIGIDRPGYGRHSFKPAGTFIDWANDAAELADALGFDPWGFPLEDIDIAVHLWHAEKDRIVPPEMARYMAKTDTSDFAGFGINLSRYLGRMSV